MKSRIPIAHRLDWDLGRVEGILTIDRVQIRDKVGFDEPTNLQCRLVSDDNQSTGEIRKRGEIIVQRIQRFAILVFRSEIGRVCSST